MNVLRVCRYLKGVFAGTNVARMLAFPREVDAREHP